jgi:hypothetical protein
MGCSAPEAVKRFARRPCVPVAASSFETVEVPPIHRFNSVPFGTDKISNSQLRQSLGANRLLAPKESLSPNARAPNARRARFR